MDDARAAILGEIATESGIERASFLTDATEQLNRFLSANRERIRRIGGLVLLDEDPDYLSIAPDGTFRSRSRYQDEGTGEWIAETEIIDSAAELVELYNPGDVYAWFAEAARAEAGLAEQPTAAEDLLEVAGVSPDAGVGIEGGTVEATDASYAGAAEAYAAAADEWAIGRTEAPSDAREAARGLYDMALTFQERSQRSEARLLEQFQEASEPYAQVLGDSMLLDDEDERLWYRATGAFEAEVVPEREAAQGEGEAEWMALTSPEDMVQFYDPTDLFGDLAEAIADQYPDVAPELEDAEQA
jgi:hypothetical protein